MKTTIILVRHGETTWNKERRVQGQTDIPLSLIGIQQAKSLIPRLKKLDITTVYSSNLKRAYQTAEIATHVLGLPIEKHSGINERSYGDHEGKFIEEVHNAYWTPHKKLLATPPNGESYTQFHDRVIKTFHEIVSKNHEKTILIVCHGGVLHVLIRHLRNIPHEEESDFRFPNTSISIFHLEEGEFMEESVADASHLEEL